VKKADVLARVGQYVWIDYGFAREPDLAIVLGYGYRQRHGRGSPVEPDLTGHVGGSQAAVAMHNNDDDTWSCEAIHLISIRPYEGEL
jgi:hypothetical protein